MQPETLVMTGGKELMQMFQELPVKVENNGLAQMTRAGTAPIRKNARSRISKYPKYAKTITTRKRKSRPGTAIFEVSSKSRLSHLLEYGVRPHVISVKNKKIMSRDGIPYGTVVNHPGMAAQPHMRPAYDSQKGAAVEAMADKARDFIFKEALKR
jgi:HK97 gp10 family phage protein